MKEFKFFQTGTLSNPQMLGQETNITASAFHEQLINQRRLIEDSELSYRFERRAIEESRRMMVEERDIIRIEPTLYVKGSIKLKPKWWMRIKMFFQKEYFFNEDFIPFTVLIVTAVSFFIILTVTRILLK